MILHEANTIAALVPKLLSGKSRVSQKPGETGH
jgi:hypothetical protein